MTSPWSHRRVEGCISCSCTGWWRHLECRSVNWCIKTLRFLTTGVHWLAWTSWPQVLWCWGTVASSSWCCAGLHSPYWSPFPSWSPSQPCCTPFPTSDQETLWSSTLTGSCPLRCKVAWGLSSWWLDRVWGRCLRRAQACIGSCLWGSCRCSLLTCRRSLIFTSLQDLWWVISSCYRATRGLIYMG